MADAPDNPLAPHTRPPYYAGQPIEFAGYVDDFDRTICAMEFSLDDGASWTAYLRVNADHADLIAEEAAHLDGGMTDHERAILLSFLEARPAYLRAYFDEIDRLYGSFAAYMREGLHLTGEAVESLRALVA